MVFKNNIKNMEIKQIIADSLNLSHLKKSQQNKIILLIAGVVSLKVNMAVWDRLSEKGREEFKKILNISGEKKVLNYINSKIKDFPKLVEDTTRKTIADFKNKRAEIKQ